MPCFLFFLFKQEPGGRVQKWAESQHWLLFQCKNIDEPKLELNPLKRHTSLWQGHCGYVSSYRVHWAWVTDAQQYGWSKCITTTITIIVFVLSILLIYSFSTKRFIYFTSVIFTTKLYGRPALLCPCNNWKAEADRVVGLRPSSEQHLKLLTSHAFHLYAIKCLLTLLCEMTTCADCQDVLNSSHFRREIIKKKLSEKNPKTK